MKTGIKITIAVVGTLIIILGIIFATTNVIQTAFSGCDTKWLSIEHSCSADIDCTSLLASQGITEDTSEIVRCEKNVCEMISYDCRRVSA